MNGVEFSRNFRVRIVGRWGKEGGRDFGGGQRIAGIFELGRDDVRSSSTLEICEDINTMGELVAVVDDANEDELFQPIAYEDLTGDVDFRVGRPVLVALF